MTDHTIWREYSGEVLAWQLGQPGTPTVIDAEAKTVAHRLLRMAAVSSRPLLALMGVGDGTLAAHVLEALPENVELCILEPSPHRARWALERMAQRQPTLLPRLLPCLLVDTSPWALLLLTLNAGLTPKNCTLARTERPHHGDSSPEAHTLDHWRKLFLSAQCERLPATAGTPRISVGAILHPAEPHLAEFFNHIPPWVHELCVIWDGALPKASPLSCPVPLRQRVRTLGNDFSGQRNAMLELCGGDWCLYLDADERLSPEGWTSLQALASMPTTSSVLFPRLTFEGSEERIRMGYGLWPDVQCRFFPLQGHVHFQGSIHERVQGLQGQPLLAPGMPIFHYSHVQKNYTQVAEKLHVFNKAAMAEGRSLHVGSAAYPSLPRHSVECLGAAFGNHTVLRLQNMKEKG